MNTNIEERMSIPFAYHEVAGWDVPIKNEGLVKSLEAFEEILEWIYDQDKARTKTVIIRIIVLRWIIKGDKTQREVARSMGISPRVFNKEVSSFRDRFEFTSSKLRSQEARQGCSQRMRDRHAMAKLSPPTPGKESF